MVKQWLAGQAYSLLLRVGTPLYLWRVWSRGQTEPTYRTAWWERLGFYGAAYRQRLTLRQKAGPLVW